MIPLNIPCFTNQEFEYIQQAFNTGHLSGNGHFTQLCQKAAESYFGFKAMYFTPSCTVALEMAALLCNFQQGDEVILPSFTHVSTANAFTKAGAELKFADCLPTHPNLDPQSVARLIGPRTRAIVLVHYGGVACEIDLFRELANANGLLLIEDAAHAIYARYNGQWLGSFGDLAAFSFHETKNIHCGEGGLLVLNRPEMSQNATEIWLQGTNRNRFESGAIPYYTWTRPGGAFQLADLNAAFLYAQLLQLPEISLRRMKRWKRYYDALYPLQELGRFQVPQLPPKVEHNAHIFYLLMDSSDCRDDLLQYLNRQGFGAVFHYQPLHNSPYAIERYGHQYLPQTDHIAGHLLRLPLFDSLLLSTIDEITASIYEWIMIRNIVE
jgi:dTDP-4-amino-4,6-dideoxygalactose transaminase